MLDKRVMHLPRCLGSKKHRDLMQSLYKIYAESMEKQWEQNTSLIKNEEQQSTTSLIQRTALTAKDLENLQAAKSVKSVKHKM